MALQAMQYAAMEDASTFQSLIDLLSGSNCDDAATIAGMYIESAETQQ